MRLRASWLMGMVALLLASASADAQSGRGGVARAQLEAELRRGFTRAVREQVGLTDAQMNRLGAVTQRVAAERRRLQLDERTARAALQRLLRDSVAADSASVERGLRRLLGIQQRRVQLLESEQAELATFMTPLQRARFLVLQEQLRRRLEQRRLRRESGDGGGPPASR